ncbi:MAG: response regulator [Lachnospiraceae bacterium]|nr:response regulator [Lachnospiraceae bacterium]
MDIDLIENSVMFIAAVAGLLACLFRYIDTPKRGWLYMTGFFLAHFLSDYYWIIYVLVLRTNPDVSALMAYFGWNLGYILLLLAVWNMRPPGSERYFHPLMLLPIPLNIWQFFIYLPYGGIANNLWEGITLTAVSCLCLQALLYYHKNKKAGVHFPHIQLLVLLFVATEYAMWTSSCFYWPYTDIHVYYFFAIVNYILMLFFAWAIGKDYEAEGLKYHEKSVDEMKFQMLLQIIAVMIFLGGGAGGYSLAVWMKNSLPAGEAGSGTYDIIAVTLFGISLVLAALILVVIFIIALRYRKMEIHPKEMVEKRRSRYSFVITICITLILMIFSVVYTSRLFYRVSVNGIMSSGEDTASLIATELDNYLAASSSALQVTADTVDLMLSRGESQERINRFLTDQTTNQAKQFDENFTGIYGYLRGEYMDGSGWVPPEGYDATARDWYNEAVAADGDVIIVPPYVDAQTHSVVITICRLISDVKDQALYGGHNVVALDVIVNHIQDITEGIDINGKGYGIVVDKEGLVVAHHDPELVGSNISDVFSGEVFDSIKQVKNGTVNTMVEDEDCTLFINDVMDKWYVIITVGDTELFEEAHSQLLVNIIVSLIIFSLITFFYYLGYKNEQAYGRKMEEMRVDRQKQEYEAKVLKLEKMSADEANKAKSRFLADMSHEIRTPINAILGMNEMILREAAGTDIIEYARNIGASGRNLLQLVNSILDFSKIEDGKMEIVPVRYGLSSLITYLVNSISERARAKNLEFIVDVDPSLPSELYGDDTRINQVIMNLLTNALKYTPEGSVTLTMKEKERQDGEVLLHVEVRDTGIGIREEDMGRLFESFERLDLVRNRNIEGTGLGMPITTKLLDLMGSGLRVDSVYGEGSVFSFDLWQKIENETRLGDYKPASVYETDARVDQGLLYAPDARILITDDTKMNLIVAVNLLKRTAIRIDTALNGEEAIGLCKKTAYDVIFMDQRMPGMDGTQTLKAIRALEDGRNGDTPVICLTADAIRGAKERYMAEGFTDYLAKPVEGEALEKALLTYLPKEKIQEKPADKDRQTDTGDAAVDPLSDALKRAGVDTKKGLVFCRKDEDMYRMILTEYARDHEERRDKLQEYYNRSDWDNYMIFAHSLKSSSKTIGALELSSIAGELEAAAGDRDEGLIRREHERAMELYKGVAAAIRENLEIADSDAGADDDPDILEFAPVGDGE